MGSCLSSRDSVHGCLSDSVPLELLRAWTPAPAPFQLWEVGRNDLLGVATDELDVERVQVFGRSGG